MPDHKPRPWEKVCPECGGQGWTWQSGPAGPDSCPCCHGDAVVPMTTAEMLEALAQRGWPYLCYIGDGDWEVSLGYTKYVGDQNWIAQNPDSALRAALEAVG